jgi:putative ABC transport system permease protein
METLFQDVRYAFRMLRKSPGFTAVAVITLALGIGATTAVFSVVYGVLLRSLPYPETQRLVVMKGNQSRVDMDDVRERSQLLEAGGAMTVQPMDFTGGTEPVRVDAGLVNAELFSVLGMKPALGRGISSEEDQVGGPRVVVLSRAFWQQQLGGDPQILGKAIPLSGQPYTVIGVMPADFVMPRGDVDVWASLRIVYPEAAVYRGVHFMRSYWRVRPGISLAAAQAEMAGIDDELARLYPNEDKGRETQLIPLQDWIVGDTRPALLILFGAVGFVLLVACANFANLLLARAVSRHSEMVIRAALGAGHWRLVSQLLTEGVLVSLLGGAAGLLVAKSGVDLLLALKPKNLPRLSAITVDWPVFLFALGAAVVTGLVFAFLPAWTTARADSADSLKEAGRGGSAGAGRHRLRSVFVVSELALALLLLTGAGLLIKGFWRLHAVDPGFTPENVLTMQIQLPESRYAEIPKQTEFRRRVLDGLNTLPGAQAAMISEVPMSGDWVYHNFVIEGRPPLAAGDEPEIDSRSVMGDYFRTMQIPLRAGRDFTAQDRAGTQLVGILNQAAVRNFFPREDPVGKRIRWAREPGPPQWITIVGVAGDVHHFGLDEKEDSALYSLYEQSNQPWKRWMTMVVRTHQDPASLVRAAKNVVWSVDPGIPVSKVRTMPEVMVASMAERRFNTLLLALFAGLALVLAAVGIYGLTSYSVTQRTHEIGIRMALGAEPRHVLGLMVGEGFRLTVIGMAIGAAAALALTRLMASLLFEVRPTDLATYSAVAGLLAAVSIVASYIPARRAAKVDPMVALRNE